MEIWTPLKCLLKSVIFSTFFISKKQTWNGYKRRIYVMSRATSTLSSHTPLSLSLSLSLFISFSLSLSLFLSLSHYLGITYKPTTHMQRVRLGHTVTYAQAEQSHLGMYTGFLSLSFSKIHIHFNILWDSTVFIFEFNRWELQTKS